MYKLGILTICRLQDLPIREQACNHYTLVKQKQDFYTGLDIKDAKLLGNNVWTTISGYSPGRK